MKQAEKRFVEWMRENTTLRNSNKYEDEYMYIKNPYFSVVFRQTRIKLKHYYYFPQSLKEDHRFLLNFSAKDQRFDGLMELLKYAPNGDYWDWDEDLMQLFRRKWTSLLK